jgi:predicted transcriptional regulator
MMTALSTSRVPVSSTNDINNIKDAMITKKQATYNESIVEQIQFPKHASAYLKDIKAISDFKITEGGTYMQSKKLTKQQKIDLTKLLTDFVSLPTTINSEESKIYQIIPNIIRQFAQGSRVGTGFRLCKRAVRHAMDPKSIDICTCSGQVFETENNKIGLVTTHKVKASMKQAVYNVQVALTSTDLLACTCTCKAGSVDQEKIVCVHILPVMFQIGQIMWKGLSKHLLVEISNFCLGENNNYLAIHQPENNCLITLRTLV